MVKYVITLKKGKKSMENRKSELIQIRVSELEKKVIKDKAELLGLSITDYVKYCCIFCNASQEFVSKLFEKLS